MTAAERIAWAVDIVRETRSVERAHQQTGVTSDVIRKACAERGVVITRPGQQVDRAAIPAPRPVMSYWRGRTQKGGNDQVASAKREKKLVASRGWSANPSDIEEAAELVGVNLHEPE